MKNHPLDACKSTSEPFCRLSKRRAEVWSGSMLDATLGHHDLREIVGKQGLESNGEDTWEVRHEFYGMPGVGESHRRRQIRRKEYRAKQNDLSSSTPCSRIESHPISCPQRPSQTSSSPKKQGEPRSRATTLDPPILVLKPSFCSRQALEDQKRVRHLSLNCDRRF